MSFGPQILAGLPETRYMGQITYVLNIEVHTAQIFFLKKISSLEHVYRLHLPDCKNTFKSPRTPAVNIEIYSTTENNPNTGFH
jgi:hypothetical protein